MQAVSGLGGLGLWVKVVIFCMPDEVVWVGCDVMRLAPCMRMLGVRGAMARDCVCVIAYCICALCAMCVCMLCAMCV